MQGNIIKYMVQVRRLEPAKNIWFKYGDLNQQRIQVRRLEPAEEFVVQVRRLEPAYNKTGWFRSPRPTLLVQFSVIEPVFYIHILFIRIQVRRLEPADVCTGFKFGDLNPLMYVLGSSSATWTR